MVTGPAKLVVLAGILIGLAVLGAIIGAGIDYATGNAGWWGAIGLAGLMAGMIAVSVVVEGTGPVRRR